MIISEIEINFKGVFHFCILNRLNANRISVEGNSASEPKFYLFIHIEKPDRR